MQTRIATTVGVLALTVMLFLPSTLLASEHNHGAPEITKQLNELQLEAAEARRHAAELETFNRSNVSWNTHAMKLEAVKAEINDMGRILAKLEDLRSGGNATQIAAIEAIRPNLQEAADNVSRAIGMLNENTASVRTPEYRDTLRKVWEETASLYDETDAFLDYQEASMRVSGAM